MTNVDGHPQSELLAHWSWKITALWLSAGVGALGLGLSIPIYQAIVSDETASFVWVLILFFVALLVGIVGISIQLKWDPVAARLFSRLTLAEIITIPVIAGLFVGLWNAFEFGWNPLAVAVLFAGLQLWACMNSNRYRIESYGIRMALSVSAMALAYGIIMSCIIVVIIIWVGVVKGSMHDFLNVIDIVMEKNLADLKSVERMLIGPFRIGGYLFGGGLFGWFFTRIMNAWQLRRKTNCSEAEPPA